MKVKSLNGSEPHPDHGGWAGFLKKCELRDKARGVLYYGMSNCNYILFPCGTLLENYGYHGRVLMGDIRRRGRVLVLKEIVDDYKAWKKAYDKICDSLGQFTDRLSAERLRLDFLKK